MSHVRAFPAATGRSSLPPTILEQSAWRPGQLAATVVPSWRKAARGRVSAEQTALGHGRTVTTAEAGLCPRPAVRALGPEDTRAVFLPHVSPAPPTTRPRLEQVCGWGPPGAVGGGSHSNDLLPPREREERDGNAGRHE